MISRSIHKFPFDLPLLTELYVLLSRLLALLWVVIPVATYVNDRGPMFCRQTKRGLRGRAFTAQNCRTIVNGQASRKRTGDAV